MTDTVSGVVEHIIFCNEDNGYTVFVLQLDEQLIQDNPRLAENLDSSELTCTGNIPNLRPGEEITAVGAFVATPKYGKQFAVAELQKSSPSSMAGIEKYLASGVIKGIGEKMARRIVKFFGEATLSVMEETPEKLAEVKGISVKKAAQIAEIFHAQAGQRRAMLYLQDYGIAPTLAVKIYKKYRDLTLDVLKHNPYKLAEDIDGIGFKTADTIAERMGMSGDSPVRIAAGVRYTLVCAANDGHCFLPAGLLLARASEILCVAHELIENELRQMQIERLIYVENGLQEEAAVFLTYLYHAELNVARLLLRGRTAARSASETQEQVEHERGVSPHAPPKKLPAGGSSPPAGSEPNALDDLDLSAGQQEAVEAAINAPLLIITGGPGTGKTTAINTIIHLLSAKDIKVELAAPTGRAAKRMTETSGREAKTLHRLLEAQSISGDRRKQTFLRDENNPIEADVLIVDEASMVDILLFQHLLKALADTRLILVGDIDQLPPIGAGNVLKDIIASECVKVVRLTEIFRQSKESAIIMNAHRINRGEQLVLNEKDFFFLHKTNPDACIAAIISLVETRLPQYLGTKDIQVLCPMRKTPLGCNSLNQVLQRRLNPPGPGKREKEFRALVFREGDKVMQIKNNYQLEWEALDETGRKIDSGEGVYNGDVGIIKAIGDEFVTVLFDDGRQAAYDYAKLEELDFAYAVTVHKSQGSEYSAVVIPLYSGPPLLFTRNLLYTAITRAKRLCVIVGLPETMHRMAENDREVERHTALRARLAAMGGKEQPNDNNAGRLR